MEIEEEEATCCGGQPEDEIFRLMPHGLGSRGERECWR